MSNVAKFAIPLLSLYIAFVFVQSLFFKFAGSPETQHIFGILDAWASDSFGISGLFVPPGPFNAYVIGTTELIASVLLLAGLMPRLRLLNVAGALMSIAVISGAIVFHLFTPLGIEVQGDGGLLFAMAVGVWLAGVFLVVMQRDLLLALIRRGDRTSS